MSAGVVFQEALRVLSQQGLPEEAERDVLRALEAGRPGPLALLFAAGQESGLERERLLPRAAACYLWFCAANLADDLADGDCDWLPEPQRTGPAAVMLLQSLFMQAAVKGQVSAAVLGEVAREFAGMCGQQQVEVRTREWRAPLLRQVVVGISGQQWAGYMRLLWEGTPLAERALELGRCMGVVGHVAEDVRSRDRRLYSLPEEEQRQVVAWALEAAAVLRGSGLGCMQAVLPTVEPLLRAA